MKYFRKFFEPLEFYKNLKESTEGLGIYLKSPINRAFQREIDKWLRFAKAHGVWEKYQKQFQQENIDFYKVKSILNELMVGYFLEKKCRAIILEHEPRGYKNKKGDWLVRTSDGFKIFIEIKSPWEEFGEGGSYSHYDKLRKMIEDGYNQLPRNSYPTLIFISDELNISPIEHDNELIQVLYGRQAICLKVGPAGPLEEAHVEIVDRRSIFQRNMHRSLGAIGILKFIVYDNSKIENGKFIWADKGQYLFKIYHNPFAFEKVKINEDIFKNWPRFVLNKEKSQMEWVE